MNKKFSTLLVGALLTSSVGAFATSTIRTVGHNIDLRPNETMSVAPTKTITKFENKLYQLSDGNGNVLVQERDLTTGVLTMKLVAATDAPINASLWTIKAIEDARSGYIFNYVNKETNMPLSIDVAKTLKATAVQATADLASANASVVEGCLENWAWYTTDDNGTTAFPVSKVYSYFTADSIAVLQKKADGTIVTVKYSKAVAGTNASSVTDAIMIQPVEAAAIVLKAEDLNRKVDFKYELADAAAAMGVVASDTFSIASSKVPTTASVFLDNKFMAEAVGTDITGATGYDADKLGITATNKMEDYVYLKTTDNKYLYVSENFYPSNSKFLKLALTTTGKLGAAPANTTMKDATWKARSAFKVTYYPSVDSLVFEPLNALSANPANNTWMNGDYAFNSVNNKLAGFFNGAVTGVADVQDATVGQVVVRIGNLTPTESVITAYNTEVDATYPLPGSLLTKFTYADRKFGYLHRATLPAGLYFIKNATTAKNLVCNFEGTMMYDAVEKYEGGEVAQNYNDMPATMWVVNTTGCTTVDVKNREYGANATAFAADPFAGQLYIDADGKYYTINKNYTGIAAKNQELNNLESYAIDAVTDNDALTSEHHGYQNLTKLNISKYNLAYNLFVNKDLFLDVTTDKNFAPSDDNSAYFEAEAVTAATDVKFGAGVGVANLPQLVRTAYTLKVYDTNLIDNDKYYVYLVEETGENPYYQAMTEAEAIAKSATASVRKGVFYLKADQVKGSDKYYVLIDINKAGIKTADLSLATDNGNVQAHCIDAVGRMSYLNLDNIASERASAFHVTSTPVALYRTIADAKTAKIFRQRGTAKEYLFEDSNNQVGAPSYVKGLGYLGLTAEGIVPGEGFTTAMYVKYVKASDEIMPQYLFAVDTMTVNDGKWCATNEHGYIQEGDAHSDHTVPYIGYLAGRFLVNLSDSIKAEDSESNTMLHNADKFKYSGYDRLGFVEAICRVEGGVEYLYILKGGNTLESIQAKYGVVDPATFADATVFDKKTLDGKHANYAFSLRLINEEAEKDFLIESKGEGSAIGSFKGAWVKVQNSCPVLAKFTTTGSDHEDETGTIEELINNAQIFNIEDGLDEVATDNETINSVSTVAVVAGNGEVIVKGAEGKKVTITNVLGQTVANTVITSNEAAISTPAGVVVVAVEGEAAVKAIVK